MSKLSRLELFLIAPLLLTLLILSELSSVVHAQGPAISRIYQNGNPQLEGIDYFDSMIYQTEFPEKNLAQQPLMCNLPNTPYTKENLKADVERRIGFCRMYYSYVGGGPTVGRTSTCVSVWFCPGGCFWIFGDKISTQYPVETVDGSTQLGNRKTVSPDELEVAREENLEYLRETLATTIPLNLMHSVNNTNEALKKLGIDQTVNYTMENDKVEEQVNEILEDAEPDTFFNRPLFHHASAGIRSTYEAVEEKADLPSACWLTMDNQGQYDTDMGNGFPYFSSQLISLVEDFTTTYTNKIDKRQKKWTEDIFYCHRNNRSRGRRPIDPKSKVDMTAFLNSKSDNTCLNYIGNLFPLTYNTGAITSFDRVLQSVFMASDAAQFFQEKGELPLQYGVSDFARYAPLEGLNALSQPMCKKRQDIGATWQAKHPLDPVTGDYNAWTRYELFACAPFIEGDFFSGGGRMALDMLGSTAANLLMGNEQCYRDSISSGRVMPFWQFEFPYIPNEIPPMMFKLC